MKKYIIGVLCSTVKEDDQNPYSLRYTVCDMFIKKLNNYNAVPIGLIGDDFSIDDNVLNLCDAFIFQGGSIINPNFYYVLDYAIKNNKPVLGICLGMQGMGIYSWVLDEYQKKYNYYDKKLFRETYDKLKEQYEGTLLTKDIDQQTHNHGFLTMENKHEFLHSVDIEEDSILYNIYNTSKMDVYSIHASTLKNIGPSFKIIAKSSDGVIEAIEYDKEGYSILGVLFHPELFEDEKIYQWLVNSINK